jgi:hypothetical protein
VRVRVIATARCARVVFLQSASWTLLSSWNSAINRSFSTLIA